MSMFVVCVLFLHVVSSILKIFFKVKFYHVPILHNT